MEAPPKDLRIAILIGSVRPGNYSSKAAALVAGEFTRLASPPI